MLLPLVLDETIKKTRNEAKKKINMKINIGKTEIMNIGKNKQITSQLYRVKIEQSNRIKYLGVIVAEDSRKIKEEIREILIVGGKLINSFKNSFDGKKEIPKERRVQVLEKMLIPIIICGA